MHTEQSPVRRSAAARHISHPPRSAYRHGRADSGSGETLLYELAVLKMYAEPLLFQVTREDKEYDEAVRLLKFLDYFLPMPSEEVPHNSILREFIGGSCFDV